MDEETFDRCGHAFQSVKKFDGFAGASSHAGDDDMQAAIEMSRRQFEQQQNDRDSEAALRRSREESSKQHHKTTVDLIGDEDADLKRAMEMSLASTKQQPPETVDLTDLTGPSNNNQKKPAAVEVIMLDDSDDEEEKKEEENKKRPAESPSPSKKKAKTNELENREMKRKLAAEAALKRLEG
ncbi:MAG: hypothetical protein SGARI_007702 [Bacillariaceae sp.]